MDPKTYQKNQDIIISVETFMESEQKRYEASVRGDGDTANFYHERMKIAGARIRGFSKEGGVN